MRLPDWRGRLRDAIAAAQSRRFRNGRHDCAKFSISCVAAMTGAAVEHFPAWSNAVQAGSVVDRYGGLRSAVEVVAADLGWEPIEPTFGAAGDLVFKADQSRFGGALGIVALDGRRAWFASDVGLADLPLTKLDQGWRI
jgi:hypothetical protein